MDSLFRGCPTDYVPGSHQRVRPSPGGGHQREPTDGESQPLQDHSLLPLVHVSFHFNFPNVIF